LFISEKHIPGYGARVVKTVPLKFSWSLDVGFLTGAEWEIYNTLLVVAGRQGGSVAEDFRKSSDGHKLPFRAPCALGTYCRICFYLEHKARGADFIV
jgi:hypothetical protein